jgi:molybdopterin synthase sulfur carrier subunit
MKLELLAFGITRDILKASPMEVEIPGQPTVSTLKEFLKSEFPQLKALKSLAVAVNKSYAPDDQLLSEKDEIALIPPVSGG